MSDQSFGRLSVNVSSLRGLRRIPDALVTVFKNGAVIDLAFTDESGQIVPFELPTRGVDLSCDSANSLVPYLSYDIQIDADGYVRQIYKNAPVFSGVTSLINADLTLWNQPSLPIMIESTPPNLLAEKP